MGKYFSLPTDKSTKKIVDKNQPFADRIQTGIEQNEM